MMKSKTKAVDAAQAAQEIKPAAGHTFKLGKKEYQYVLPQFRVEGIGLRTALEAVMDKTAYPELQGKTINEYLVEIGSGVVKAID